MTSHQVSHQVIKDLSEVLLPNQAKPHPSWHLKMILHEECLSYVVWNETSREMMVIDPKRESLEAYRQLRNGMKGYLCLGIVDTHTHADHVTAAPQLAEEFQAPLMMHETSATTRAHLRISRPTTLPSRAGGVRVAFTPGHTPDGITLIWGPFAFTGDTVLFGDVGRDDLPGGDAAAHYESLQILKKVMAPDTLVCPGHDFKGGRVSTWATQLEVNSSLTQEREEFIRECLAFDAPAPALFKKALFENLK